MVRIDLERALEVAVEAARAGGEILREKFGRVKEVEYKGATDLVTEADKASETTIIHILQFNYPRWSVLAEESGARGESDVRWIVDPLDGTTNYAHSYPFFCVSIALEAAGEIVAGVVFDPVREELFRAVKGGGAFLNERKIRVSSTCELGKSLLITGFPYNVREEPGLSFDYFREFVLRSQAVRRDGTAALDLAYVASGRGDGFWEEKLAPWDLAAGSLLVKEAGGKVSTFEEEFTINAGNILASNGLIHKDMQEVLAPGKGTPA